MSADKTCSIDGCANEVGAKSARGWCGKHYSRWLKNGDPNIVTAKIKPTIQERFWEKVIKGSECWNWKAQLGPKGYGRFRIGRKMYLAHRLSFAWEYGEIPSSLLLDHTCHNHSCVRPSHLRHATVKQNAENRKGARRNSKSGVRGVYPVVGSSRWWAGVRHNGKMIRLGSFATIPEAEAAALKKRLELFTHNIVDIEKKIKEK